MTQKVNVKDALGSPWDEQKSLISELVADNIAFDHFIFWKFI